MKRWNIIRLLSADRNLQSSRIKMGRSGPNLVDRRLPIEDLSIPSPSAADVVQLYSYASGIRQTVQGHALQIVSLQGPKAIPDALVRWELNVGISSIVRSFTRFRAGTGHGAEDRRTPSTYGLPPARHLVTAVTLGFMSQNSVGRDDDEPSRPCLVISLCQQAPPDNRKVHSTCQKDVRHMRYQHDWLPEELREPVAAGYFRGPS